MNNNTKNLIIIIIIIEAILFVFFPSEAIIVAILFGLIYSSKIKKNTSYQNNSTITNKEIERVKCPNCGHEANVANKFCIKCGTKFVVSGVQNNIISRCNKCGGQINPEDKYCNNCGCLLEESPKMPNLTDGVELKLPEYDSSVLEYSENGSLTLLINKELEKSGENNKASISAIEKRKNIFNLIYAIVIFLLLSLYYIYHSNGTIQYGIMILIVSTVIYLMISSNYNITNYLIKEVKSRPDEKISYIVANVLTGKVINKRINKIKRVCMIGIAIIIPILIFNSPHIIYEKSNDGYVVRYYTIGSIKNNKKLTIPSKYKGENIVGIRGDVFEHVNSLEEVVLPDTIKEIRGGAFQYCKNLKSINLPKNITEIKGSTFEGCENLESIEIPEGVVRIGGSAFRDCYKLRSVSIPKTVAEIGSSAFRNTSIYRVCIARDTYVNERAFKGTYTTTYYYEDNCEAKNEVGEYYGY